MMNYESSVKLSICHFNCRFHIIALGTQQRSRHHRFKASNQAVLTASLLEQALPFEPQCGISFENVNNCQVEEYKVEKCLEAASAIKSTIELSRIRRPSRSYIARNVDLVTGIGAKSGYTMGAEGLGP